MSGLAPAVVAALMLLVGVLPATAQSMGAETGLPLPRFVSLRAKEANIRTGPGTRYPVEWVYKRRFMPLEIVAEFENWRRIRDWEGTEGWMHKSMLSGRRTALVTAVDPVLRREPAETADPVAKLEPGVIGTLMTCAQAWCRLDVKGIKGWLPRTAIWGAYAKEKIQ